VRVYRWVFAVARVDGLSSPVLTLNLPGQGPFDHRRSSFLKASFLCPGTARKLTQPSQIERRLTDRTFIQIWITAPIQAPASR
jgi:hypothetical protein